MILLAVLLLLAVACNSANVAPAAATPESQPEEPVVEAIVVSNSNDGTDIGEGATIFSFEVTDDGGEVTTWIVHTDESTVGAALVDAGLIEGAETDMGLMVERVNGLRADYNEDGAWWAFYIDGEMAMVGVDATDIEKGVTYAFVYTEA